MSSVYKLCSIVDSQLEDITSEITLPVITGSNSSVYVSNACQPGSSTSTLQFNVNPPNVQTAMSRNVLIQTTVTLRIDFTGDTQVGYWALPAVNGVIPDSTTTLFDYGYSNSLQAFPFNSLISTAMATINGQQISVNTRDCMAPLLKLYNYTELAKYNSLTPSLIDSFYSNFTDGLGSNNNVLANYSVGGYSKEYQPRGCFPCKMTDLNGNAMNNLIVQTDAAGTSPVAGILLTFTTTEPLLFLSPLISGNSDCQAALLGVATFSVTLNIGDTSRVMSNASYGSHAGVNTQTIGIVSLSPFTNSNLLMNYLSIPPTLGDKIEPRNVVNYNNYISLPGNLTGSLAAGQSKAFPSSTFTLGQVPSKMLIYAKKVSPTTYDSNSFAVISGITINFTNKTGSLSGATAAQLYNLSVKNGLQMNFYEFGGVGVSSNNGVPTVVPTIGSILVIDPSIDLGMDAQYTNMSQGQFSINFTITLQNQTTTASDYMIYILNVNSGIFVTENGISTASLALLTCDQVLDTKEQDAVMDKKTYEEQIVGGSIENLNCVHKHMKLNYHKASEIEHRLDHTPGESILQTHHNSGSGMDAAGMGKRRLHKYTKK